MHVDPNQKSELIGQTVDPLAILPGTIIPVVKDIVNNFQTGTSNLAILSSPPINRDPKRSKHGTSVREEGMSNNAKNLNSAGSYGERHQDQ